MATKTRIVVIGGGCAGLAAAYHLQKSENAGIEVTLYEADSRLGGHANTVDVEGTPVDTGFMVYNSTNYPYLLGLFDELGVEGISTNMGFSVSMDSNSFEWCADTLAGLFATPSNIFNPKFYFMISDIFKFNKKAKEILALPPSDPIMQLTVSEFLSQYNFSDAFSKYYLIPMTAAIWSASSTGILHFPIIALFTFLENHLLLQTSRNLTWMTPAKRSTEYVQKISNILGSRVSLNKNVVTVLRDASKEKGGVVVVDSAGVETVFDKVLFACHPDQARGMIEQDPRSAPEEISMLKNFTYSDNVCYLHSDETLMPKNKAAWTSWNYIGVSDQKSLDSPVFVTYWLNQLQSLSTPKPIFVSLNPKPEPAADKIHQCLHYAHPQYTLASVAAQKTVSENQGRSHTYFAGAWLGYGFHEDGIRSGFEAAMLISGKPVGWKIRYPNSAEGASIGTIGKMTMSKTTFLVTLAGPFMKLIQKLSKEALFYFLGKGFSRGKLSFVCPDGNTRVLGQGGMGAEREITVKVTNDRFFARVALEYDLGLCRSFIAGEWELPELGADYQGLTRFFDLIIDNTYTVTRKTTKSIANIAINNLPTAWIGSLLNSLMYFVTMDNSVANSRMHIHAHYDLSNDLFRTFLDDQTMMYSCAVFQERYDPHTGKVVLHGSLEDAQERKINALLQRLQISKHHTLLDIGFGWGGIAIAAAEKIGCRVHGITLSTEQKKLAEERVRAKGLSHLITFELCDYRVFANSGRTFDRIVSCEMIEAVGHKYLSSFFDTVDRLLALDGIFVMQAITMPDSRYPLYKKSADFCNTIIFPGGCCPSLQALIDAMATQSTLHMDSVININLHYAETLRLWRLRFNANIAQVKSLGFDTEFIRIWNLYLCMCESSFSHSTINLQQITFSRTGNSSLFSASASCPQPQLAPFRV